MRGYNVARWIALLLIVISGGGSIAVAQSEAVQTVPGQDIAGIQRQIAILEEIASEPAAVNAYLRRNAEKLAGENADKLRAAIVEAENAMAKDLDTDKAARDRFVTAYKTITKIIKSKRGPSDCEAECAARRDRCIADDPEHEHRCWTRYALCVVLCDKQ